MWVKKSRKEIIKSIIIDYVKFFIMFFIGFNILFEIMNILHLQSRNGAGASFYNYYQVLSTSLFFTIVITTLFAIPYFKIVIGEQLVICNSCNKVKHHDIDSACKCGGKYILIDFMKKVKDDDKTKNRKNK